jgi:hypothetical protein
MIINKNDLKQLLKKNTVEIKFKKKDGSERVMNCTLVSDVVPVYEKKTERVKPDNDNLIAVWDLDKEAFRSFKLDSVIDYKVIEEAYEL